MALFKIEKGLAANLTANRPNTTEGYCYVTTDDGKFYIDTATAQGTENRIVLNAGTADKTKGTLTIQSPEGEILGSFNGQEDTVIELNNGGLTEPIILTENISYGTELPETGINGQLFFLEGEDIALPAGGTAGQVLVKNSTEDGDATWSSNISGNAATATTAEKLSSNAGSSTQPIYFTGGKPVACGSSLGVSVTGSSGSCTGNAATATKLSSAKTITLTGDVSGSTSFDGSGNVSITTTVADNSHNHTNYLPLAGGTMTGQIKSSYSTGGSWILGRDNATVRNTVSTSTSSFAPIISSKTQLGSWELGPCHPQENFYFSYATDTNYNNGSNTTATTVYIKNNGTIMGAAWNDYAEYRICNEDFKPGQVVYEVGDDTMNISTNRLQRGCSIVSDTFGFAIGETEEAKCPIAVSGRVLAYGYEDREEFKKHIGWPVCSGPNGTVSIMTEEEEERYPSRIIGTISAVPEYKTWGEDNIAVNNRIWIHIR